MKTIAIALFLLITAQHHVYAVRIKSIMSSGTWIGNTSWNLNRIPNHNDTVTIQTGHTMKVSSTFDLTNVVVEVYGTLLIEKGDLKLSSSSIIYVYQGGKVTGNSAGIIEIGGIKKFDYSNPNVLGPAYASNSTGNEPNGFESMAVLGVEFASFNADRNGMSAHLTWSTVDQTDNNYFEVERSSDGQSWSTVGRIYAQKQNQSTFYHYIDNPHASDAIYYRIKQVSKDGTTGFSKVKMLVFVGMATQNKIYKSAEQRITIQTNKTSKKVLLVRVMSMQGYVLSEHAFSGDRIDLQVPVDRKGVYVVQITGEGVKETKTILL